MIPSDVLKLGGIFGGLVVGLVIVVMIIRYLAPLAIALKPANGNGTQAGAMMLALQQIATLPGEVKSLTTAINTMMSEVPKKSELLKQFEVNRHHMRNIAQEGVGKMTEVVEDLRTTKKDRRRMKRGKERRRT